jgi:N-acetylneuraminic acid mutarotase
MQHRNSLCSKTSLGKKKVAKSRFWQIGITFVLLASTVIFSTLTRYDAVSAQAQQAQSKGVSEAASLSEAQRAAAEQNAKSLSKEASEKSEIETTATNEPIFPSSPSVDQCGWTAAAPITIPILDNGVTTIGNNLYSFAGVSGTIIANAYKFDGTTWTAIAPVPTAVEYPAVTTDGTNAYIINGVNSSGTAVNTVYRYNVATNTYTTLASTATATWNSRAVFLNGKIYKIAGATSSGGTSAGSNVVEVYDIASNTWSAAANYPLALGFVQAIARNGYIYSAGGVDFTSSSGSLKTYRYDPATNAWDDAAMADLPADRWGGASDYYNNGFVIAGGYVGGTLSNTVVEYDLVANNWRSLPNMPQARARMNGSVLSGNFYVIGGRSSAGGFAGTNDNQKLNCIDQTQPFVQGTVTIIAENGNPPNGVPDPGETLTVRLDLQNVGGVPTGPNVTATLQATGGVTNPSGPQNYGTLTPGASPTSRNFTFTVSPSATCGSQVTLTFTVTDGATTYTITKTYTLGVLQTTLNENFDGVTAPALPTGWTALTASGNAWVTSTTSPDSPPNAAFADDPATISDKSLVSPPVNITATNAVLTFRNNYNTENTFDGMVLETSTNNGTTWTDIVAAGGAFVAGGYNGTISSSFQSPIGGRQAWTGNSNGYITTTVNLPASFNGQTVLFRWRMASDTSVSGAGVRVDNVTVSTNYQCATIGRRSRLDYDGDGKTDIGVYRSGTWFVQRSSAGFAAVQWGGASGDILVPADYDGDGKADYAIYRPTNTVGQAGYIILNSSSNTVSGIAWGVVGDQPVIGDYNGDGRADFAVYRSSNNTWYVLPSGGSASTLQIFQIAGTDATFTPISLDYDGDGRADAALVKNGNWYIRRSTNSAVQYINWGIAADRYVPGDYDGDGRDDVAIYRNGQWVVLQSATNTPLFINFGLGTDVPVPGDYNGDGRADAAVYRGGVWYIQPTGGGAIQSVQFGLASDTPLQTAYTR